MTHTTCLCGSRCLYEPILTKFEQHLENWDVKIDTEFIEKICCHQQYAICLLENNPILEELDHATDLYNDYLCTCGDSCQYKDTLKMMEDEVIRQNKHNDWISCLRADAFPDIRCRNRRFALQIFDSFDFFLEPQIFETLWPLWKKDLFPSPYETVTMQRTSYPVSWFQSVFNWIRNKMW